MNRLDLKKIIKEEILMVLKEDILGTYRRLVIKTDFKKAIEIKSEINKAIGEKLIVISGRAGTGKTIKLLKTVLVNSILNI